MSGFTIRPTPSGMFVAESRFQRLGIRKNEADAERLIERERARLKFFDEFKSKYPQTYEGQMQASHDAAVEWRGMYPND